MTRGPALPPPSFTTPPSYQTAPTGGVRPAAAHEREEQGGQPLRVARRLPLSYVADPDDMARAALFLLSDESRWTTGTVLVWEGGVSAG